VVVESGTSNISFPNTFSNNNGLGIDLGGDGVTANDAGDGDTGANDLQNFPELTNVEAGAQTIIDGTLNSTTATTFVVNFYASDQCNPSGNGEGAMFLGSVGVSTDANGDATFSFTSDISTTIGQFVTATATNFLDRNTSEFSACFQIITSVAEQEDLLPTSFALLQNYPNPFNPATQIKYDLPDAANVRLIIYNPLGQVVRTLVQANKPPGSYSVVWDGKDDLGKLVASGNYYYQIIVGEFESTKNMLLLK